MLAHTDSGSRLCTVVVTRIRMPHGGIEFVYERLCGGCVSHTVCTCDCVALEYVVDEVGRHEVRSRCALCDVRGSRPALCIGAKRGVPHSWLCEWHAKRCRRSLRANAMRAHCVPDVPLRHPAVDVRFVMHHSSVRVCVTH